MLHDLSRQDPAKPKSRILCVEDDAEIARMLTGILEDAGFAVSSVRSAAEMNAALRRESADLLVLDVMLPGENGFNACRRLRAHSRIPILMLTALGEVVDRVVGLEIGADDYVTKPFNPRELVARIRALLRRTDGAVPAASRLSPLRFMGWSIDPGTRQVFEPGGLKVTMTSTEFDLLLAFCRNPGRVLSREELLDLTHGGLAGPVERSIDVHVSRIRQKIEPDPKDPAFIKTVRLGGYLFTPAVEPA
jgi:two-component system, OmpR family, response regulator